MEASVKLRFLDTQFGGPGDADVQSTNSMFVRTWAPGAMAAIQDESQYVRDVTKLGVRKQDGKMVGENTRIVDEYHWLARSLSCEKVCPAAFKCAVSCS